MIVKHCPLAALVFVPCLHSGSLGTVRHDYVLTGGPDGFMAHAIALNGALLAVGPDGSLPPMSPAVITTGTATVTLPPLTYGFYVFPDAAAPTCK